MTRLLGKPELTLYINDPQTPQKLFVIVLPVAMVLLWANCRRCSFPRTCLTLLSVTIKFEANMEAVILRQSVQLQMNVSTRSSPSVGFKEASGCEQGQPCKGTHEFKLYGTAETSRGCTSSRRLCIVSAKGKVRPSPRSCFCCHGDLSGVQ